MAFLDRIDCIFYDLVVAENHLVSSLYNGKPSSQSVAYVMKIVLLPELHWYGDFLLVFKRKYFLEMIFSKTHVSLFCTV